MQSLKTLEKIIKIKERELRQQKQKIQQIHSKINFIERKIENLRKEIYKVQTQNVSSIFEISMAPQNVIYLSNKIEKYILAKINLEKTLEKELSKLKDIFSEKRAIETLKNKIELQIKHKEEIKERNLLDEFASRKYISNSS